MGKKGRKTRWRKLPIPIGNGGGSRAEGREEEENQARVAHEKQPSRTTFNEDEYTKITTPRQDMLFKKGYLGRKKAAAAPTPTPSQDTADAHSAAGDSIEGEQYCCEEGMPPYMYQPPGYVDPSGYYYVQNYEMYDPYTGGVTVVVGPAPPQFQHPAVLAALPCGPVPLQPLEWFGVPPPHHQPMVHHQPHQQPLGYQPVRKKSTNSIDSQNWSGQGSESSCPPGSPQESAEQCELQPYIYPGYMFGPQVYNVNGVNVQGVLPPPVPQTPSDQAKRRKKRRRRRRGGVTDDGSESSCEEVCSIEAVGSSSSSSKTNSDSGIATDPCGASGGQGSLSSLSNDEAEKDSKSIPSEGDILVKEEDVIDATEEVVEETNAQTFEEERETVQEVEIQRPESVTSDCSNDDKTPECDSLEEIKVAETVQTPESEPKAQRLEEVESVDLPEAVAEIDLPQENQIEEATIQQEEELLPKEEVIPQEQTEDNYITEIEDSMKSVALVDEDLKAVEQTEVYSSPVRSFETVNAQKELEAEDETTEVFSAEEFEEDNVFELKNAYSSGDSTPQCTAEDRSPSRFPGDAKDEEQLGSCSEEEKAIASFNDVSMYDLNHLELEPDPPPVAPPRRKKSAKVAEKLANKISEVIVEEAVGSVSEVRYPITSAVAKWLEDSEDELEIEEAEEALTGQKNGEGNPFLAPSHSDGAGTRVASDSSSDYLREWYRSGEAGDTRRRRVSQMCDPVSSVNKYYRLALPIKGGAAGPGPFACGPVCCIIQ